LSNSVVMSGSVIKAHSCESLCLLRPFFLQYS
jgi:hypothetical protein